jgi:hypothetical protein
VWSPCQQKSKVEDLANDRAAADIEAAKLREQLVGRRIECTAEKQRADAAERALAVVERAREGLVDENNRMQRKLHAVASAMRGDA